MVLRGTHRVTSMLPYATPCFLRTPQQQALILRELVGRRRLLPLSTSWLLSLEALLQHTLLGLLGFANELPGIAHLLGAQGHTGGEHLLGTTPVDPVRLPLGLLHDRIFRHFPLPTGMHMSLSRPCPCLLLAPGGIQDLALAGSFCHGERIATGVEHISIGSIEDAIGILGRSEPSIPLCGNDQAAAKGAHLFEEETGLLPQAQGVKLVDDEESRDPWRAAPGDIVYKIINQIAPQPWRFLSQGKPMDAPVN